jgi:acyl-CoA reductase-like NAD-dependent aldehyde dehydrogenase
MPHLDEDKIAAIVERVVARLEADLAPRPGPAAPPAAPARPAHDYAGCAPPPPRAGRAPAATGASRGRDGVFAEIDDAVEAATRAQKQLLELSLETRRNLIEAMRAASRREWENLARMAVEETGLGRVEDKIIKNRLATEKTPGIEDLQPWCLSGDHGLTLHELAPLGILASITPSTNPTETIMNNGLSMLASGNAVVFNTHPGAKGVSAYYIQILNRAIVSAGGPANLLCCIENPTIESAQALMKHPGIRVNVVTGGPAVVKQALQSGKRAICAGPGNPPVVVDETAHLSKAAKGIVDGASFDNNIICTCEKEIIAVAEIADMLKREMHKYGAVEVKGRDVEKLAKVCLTADGRGPNREWIGKDAGKIAAAAGVSVPGNPRLLFCEVESEDHPFVQHEMLMPVIPLVRVHDVDEAIAMAVRVEHGFRHTAVIYSTNIESMHKMANAMDCSIFVKNGPNFCGLGYGGEGSTAWTIAGTTGEGITTARTFTRLRRCTLVDYFRIV